ncbi:unnamed protein product [Acanthoscelides obtectus]|uniref:Uncharacterized protein n=1 Tax=Acanthoscelides obtectus TaxID=200917 RepID=A0A9P0KNX1_ACAOB|nr:unnamed protein product [Acanthoscelides obtectus]CAK1655824.1 hypothetical protein AOBTE_LOCUS19367 [Acanthoscelides obtectus]
MAKTKKIISRQLEKMREAKKMSMRRAREKIRNDPVHHAEEKVKDRYRKRNSRRNIQDLSEREQKFEKIGRNAPDAIDNGKKLKKSSRG